MQASSFFIGPHKTPMSVRWLIGITVFISLLAPIISYFLVSTWHLSGPTTWLSLSLLGLRNGWFWQLITYIFVHHEGLGISLSSLISLFFQMLLLWFAGSEIANRFGNGKFLFFYLGSGLIAGIMSAACLLLFSSSAIVAGASPPIFALMVIWAMLNPHLDLFFFFLIRIQAKWLVALYLGFALLIHLSYGHFIAFIADLSGICFGFLMGLLVWKLENPFPLNLDLPTRKSKHRGGKIIDITPYTEEDEAFMDRMLDKISRLGESSLTPSERRRMQKISDKKKQS